MNKKSLLETHPEIATEWHPTKNGKLTPKAVTAGKGIKVWWSCTNGHEWEAKICNRTRPNKGGCPYCSNRKLCTTNCLAIVYPEIATQWHPTKNGNLTPYDVICGGRMKIWWICKNGHEWEATIHNRVKSEGRGCPYCCGQRVCIDNCLATRYPKIAAQWHPTKNGKLTPYDITAYSNKEMWWICKMGHEWKTCIRKRNHGEGCPYCSGHKVCIDNCLVTLYPEIAVQWHPTQNGNIAPYNVTAHSNKKVWWICKNGHEWKAKINSRSDGNGCPYCNSYVLKNGERYDSLIECLYALRFHNDSINFIHNVMYPDFGKRKFDFYLPEKNEYWEVTSFNPHYKKIWPEYIKKIDLKKQYVEGVLKAKFTFVQGNLTPEEIHYVRKNLETA